jgi:hypothetical protein
MDTIDVGAIDWNAAWMQAQWQNIDSGHGGECWHSWADKETAKEFFRHSLQSQVARERIADICSMIRGGARTLDIVVPRLHPLDHKGQCRQGPDIGHQARPV